MTCSVPAQAASHGDLLGGFVWAVYCLATVLSTGYLVPGFLTSVGFILLA